MNLRTLASAVVPKLFISCLRRSFPVQLLRLWARAYSRLSYSQDNEDLLIENLLVDTTTPGFYVDVGAYHPAKYSNTLLFYLKGWRGMNIDPLPGSMRHFHDWRPLDTNLELAISESKGEAQYFMFNAPELNCFGEELAQARSKVTRFKILGKCSVRTQPLRSVFLEYLPNNSAIDFLTIDAEGMDLEVLKSNDWNRWRPSLVLAEDLHVPNLSAIDKTALGIYMRSIGYLPCAKTRLTLFFAEASRFQITDFGPKVRRV